MKKTRILAVVLMLLAFQLNAQFTRTYQPGTTQDPYSMRGYDLTLDDGKYYYTAGNEEHKVIFEIDPSDGSILTPSTKIATFDNTGSQTGIGKNSVAVAPYFQDPNDPWGPPCCFNLLYLTGMDLSLQPANAMFESHGVYDNGSTFNAYVNSSLPAQQLIPGNPGQQEINGWLLDADYADQTTYQDYRYMVGTDDGNYYGGGNARMFVIKHHNGLNANISAEFVDGTVSMVVEGDPDVPTRAVNDPVHGTMTVFGGAVHDGTNYIVNPVLMDPGMWWVDHNMNTTVHKTYHNASGITNENFGVAQSHIVVNQGVTNGSGQTLQYSLIVSSGNNPQSTTGSTDQFQMGRWNKNYFHLLRDWDYAGVAEALRLSFVDNPGSNPDLGTFYTDVQVGDIVEVEDGFLIVGTVVWSERYETTDDDGLPILAALDMDKIFMIKLDKPANMFNNPTFAYAKFFNGLPVNPKDIDEVQANRVKVIGNDVFIIGSYSSTTTPNQRTSVLIKTDIDNQLQHECTIPLDVTIEELDVYEVNAEEGETSATPDYHPDYHFYGIQRVAPGTVVCTPPPPPTPEDITSIGLTGDLEKSISLFPNPANDQISISGMTAGDATLVIVDVKGQRVFEYSGAVSENHNLNISTLDKGVYFIQITQNEQMRSIKLIKD